MSYSFTPLTEEEIDAISLMEDGIYNFEVVKSTKKQSSSGNPMIVLELNFWDKEGKNHLVYDFLVFTHVPLNIRKLKHFCEAVGLGEDYKKGSLPESLERYVGKAQVGRREPQPNQNGGFHPKKNYVIDYVLDSVKEKGTMKPDSIDDAPLNDEIPF